MKDPKIRFWTGNAILAGALGYLFFMDTLSELMGIWAMLIWMVLAAVGVYFLTSGKGGPPGMPD